MAERHPAEFATTQWSVVLRAGGEDTPQSRDAFSWLCEKYWHPIYCYIRRKGHDPDQSEDLTQEFFVWLLDAAVVEKAVPEKGRFRCYLLSCLHGFLSNQQKRSNAQKRGGGALHLSLDCEKAERQYQFADPKLPPDRLFDRRWALDVLARAMGTLSAEQGEGRQRERFDALNPFLTGDGTNRIKETAALLEISEEAARVTLHRYRRRLGVLIRKEIAESLNDDTAVDLEVEYLISALG